MGRGRRGDRDRDERGGRGRRVLAEIDDHLGDEPFAVIGNSFGGMIARHVAHERRDHVLGVATLAGVVHPAHADRAVPERTVLHIEPSVLEAAGDARDAFEEVSVIQDAAAFAAFERYVLPGLRGADPVVMDRIAADYALEAVPEERHPEPFTAPALHVFGRQDDVVGYEDGLALRTTTLEAASSSSTELDTTCTSSNPGSPPP